MTTEEAPRELRTSPEIGGMGHSVKRKEDPRFIRGAGEYIDDVNLPGQLWLDIARSPYAHATIKSIDSSEALKVPGVLAVITGKDLEGYKLHWMPTLAGDMQMVLPTDTVMYQSQEVAAVIATSRYAAADGVAAVLVDYEPLPVVTDPYKALEAGAPVLRPDRGEDKQTNHIWHWASGDADKADAALAASAVRVKEHIYIPRIHVASIETCGCVADWDPIRSQLTLHMTSQAPHAIRTVVALVAAGAGLPISEQNIRVKTHDIGGGFGGKVPVYPGYVLAVAASFLIGKPVKWIEDRSENLQADSFARDYHIDIEVGATKDGRIQAMKVKTIADHGYTDAAADPSKFPAGLFNVITGSYDFDNAFVEVDGVYTNKPPGGVAYRCSFRVTEAVHAVERIVDVLAHEIGKDPAQLRMENFIQPEQFPYKTPTGWEYDSGDYPRGAAEGARPDRLRRAPQGAGREARARRADGHRHQQLHRDRRRRAVARLRHPRPEDVRLVRDPGPSDGQGPGPASASRPRARATRRRSPRSSPRSSASRSATSRSSTATPTPRPTGSARTPRAPRRSPARRRRWRRARSATRRASSPPTCSRRRRTTSNGSPASSASRAHPIGSRPSRTSPSRRTPTTRRGWRPASRRSTTTTRRT